jgi:hypothetical protein
MESENRQKTDRTVPKTAFKPGQSGNPGGRKPKTEPERRAEELFRMKTPHAAKTLLEMADDAETPVKVRADICKYVIDRTLGKPRTSGELELSGDAVMTFRWADAAEGAGK